MKENICPHCGASLMEGAEACWKCGEKLPKDNKKNTFLLLILAVVLITAAAVLYRVLL